ncbi:MAG: Na/Pi cotransporter family protein [Oscillibacter sp.]|jgi:phosphate:Na+ symporter|nr:Na/Pi cotransporter family protein [Oscillibacter sp.]
MDITSVISLLGGLAFFLFGMSLMGDALKKVAGGKLQTTLEKLTSTPLKGVLLGTFVTAVIQSSSATSVMVVGFVNSGVMQLSQAIAIIMGANIGTTATGWLLSLASVNGSSAASLLSPTVIFAVVAVIGILLYMTAKTNTRRNVGVILLALSVLMSGMKTMSSAMEPLQNSQSFVRILSVVSNPILCVLIGILVTAVVQSCSASIGILQAMSATGLIGYQVSVYMVVGMSVGACVPVLLSAIGASKNGKRAAFSYLYFNVLGGGIFLALFAAVNAAVGGLPFLQGAATSVGIAIINTVFKVFAVVVLFPFRSLLEKLSVRTFPNTPEDEEDREFEANLLDDRFLPYPSVALEQASKTAALMAFAARKNLHKSIELLETFDQVKYDKIQSREDRVDQYEDRLGSYLVKLSAKDLSDAESRKSAVLLQSLTNLERISDHATNIAELGDELHTRNIDFSEAAKEGMSVCVQAVLEIVDLAYQAFTQKDLTAAIRVEPLEDTIDAMTERLKAQHVNRLQAGQCTLQLGFIFNDCITNFERVADHCSNIALIELENQKTIDLASHSYEANLKASQTEAYQSYVREYQKKYLDRVLDEQEDETQTSLFVPAQ